MATYPELANRVVLITGAARGIGESIALAFAGQHCRLALCDIAETDESLRGSGEYAKLGGQAQRYECDVRKTDDVERMVGQVIKDFAGIDVLINNAGVCRDGVVWKLTDADWETVLGTNLSGSFHLIRAVAPQMRRQRSGR